MAHRKRGRDRHHPVSSGRHSHPTGLPWGRQALSTVLCVTHHSITARRARRRRSAGPCGNWAARPAHAILVPPRSPPPLPCRYRATLPDGTPFDEAGEGAEVAVVVDDEQARARLGARRGAARLLWGTCCGHPWGGLRVATFGPSSPRAPPPRHHAEPPPTTSLQPHTPKPWLPTSMLPPPPAPQVPEGVDLALMKMKQGERALVTISDPK